MCVYVVDNMNAKILKAWKSNGVNYELFQNAHTVNLAKIKELISLAWKEIHMVTEASKAVEFSIRKWTGNDVLIKCSTIFLRRRLLLEWSLVSLYYLYNEVAQLLKRIINKPSRSHRILVWFFQSQIAFVASRITLENKVLYAFRTIGWAKLFH